MILTAPIIELYRYGLTPIAPFTWLGYQISTLDLLATFRLCFAMRQLRENLKAKPLQVKKAGVVEHHSFVRMAAATLLVVYGGEALTAPWLGTAPSFMVSGVFPLLYTAVQAIMEYIPHLPVLSPEGEFILSGLDGFSRAYLLCNLLPPAVTANASFAIATSPWALLVASFLGTNAGYFFANMFSFFDPTAMTLRTPAEFQPYGWTTLDLWSTPLITALFAVLTHAQPFWAETHSVLATLLGSTAAGKALEPVDAESARALCALILVIFFSARTANNLSKPGLVTNEKTKIQ